MRDVIEIAVGILPKKIFLKKATGVVNKQRVTLTVTKEIDKYNDVYYIVTGEDGKSEFRLFTTRFFAVRYYNKLVEKHNLKEK